MNLDRSGAAVAPNQSAKNGAAVARPRPEGSDRSGEPGATSFQSVLTAMEPDPGAQSDANRAPAGDVALDPSTLLAQNPNRTVKPADLDGAALTTQVAAGAVAGVPLPGAAAPALASPGVVAAGAALAAGRPAAPGGQKTADKPDATAVTDATAATDAQPGAVADPFATQASLRQRDLDRSAQSVGSVLSANNAAVRAHQSRLAAEIAHLDWRSASAAQTGTASALGAPLPEIGGSAAIVAANSRTGGPVLRPLLAPAGSALSGSWAEPAVAGGSIAVGPTFALDAAATTPPSVVAEKVNYWISRGVQNAQLELDAFGGGSVEVSISVHGNEAIVEFRTDQPEARKMLQDAMPQLKDMLKGEGMVLSGGFVGTSGQPDPGAPGRRSKAHGAKASVVSAELAVAERTSPLSRTPGRVVDLFV